MCCKSNWYCGRKEIRERERDYCVLRYYSICENLQFHSSIAVHFVEVIVCVKNLKHKCHYIVSLQRATHLSSHLI